MQHADKTAGTCGPTYQYVLFSARCFRTFWTMSVLVLLPPRSRRKKDKIQLR